MKRFAKILLVFTLLILTTGCGNKNLKQISYKKYHQMLENKETFVLEIMRKDCSACKNFKPKLTQVLKDYNITIYYIDTDKLSKKESDKLYEETGISGTPTVIFYKNGVEETKSSRINGSVSTDRIIAKFKANGIIDE